MIKIEKLTNDTKATIERTGAGKVNLYPTMLLTNSEFATLDFSYGSITYSIDELEIKTISIDELKINKDKNESNTETAGTTSADTPDIPSTSISDSTNTTSDPILPVAEVITPAVEQTGKNTPKKVGKTVK